jgi:hypothetical protein
MKKFIVICDHCGHEAPSTGDGPAFVHAADGHADLHGCSSAHLWLAVKRFAHDVP